MTLHQKDATHLSFAVRTSGPNQQMTAPEKPPAHRLPPLTKGLFDSLFRLDARRTSVAAANGQDASVVPLFQNPEIGEPQ